jgi:hypothetical protein
MSQFNENYYNQVFDASLANVTGSLILERKDFFFKSIDDVILQLEKQEIVLEKILSLSIVDNQLEDLKGLEKFW